MPAWHPQPGVLFGLEAAVHIVRQLVIAGAIFVAYAGVPGTDDNRCLWPTNPNSPECAVNELPS